MEEQKSAYRELTVWKKAMQNANDVIDVSENLSLERKHYRLIEQLESSVTSIPMNIAEGKGRRTPKEFTYFLTVARGSLYETLTLLELFSMRGWINPHRFSELESQSNEIARIINGLIRSYNDKQP